MREIVVISGKGGTGKTSVTAALAALADNAILCDLDVDAPDLHILLDPQIQSTTPFISGNHALLHPEQCIGCGRCAQLCAFGAVSFDKGDPDSTTFAYREQKSIPSAGVHSVSSIPQSHAQGSVRGRPHIDSLRCEGCGVCVKLCPAQALDFPESHCGDWYVSRTRFGTMVHAQLFPGKESSGKLVGLLKTEARRIAKAEGKSMIICDGSPGVGCPVIASLSGADIAVGVVEPTPSGRHDFARIEELCKQFRIPLGVIINKWDLNPEEYQAIVDHCAESGLTLLGKLPFDAAVTKAMTARKSLMEFPSPLTSCLRDIWTVLQGMKTGREILASHKRS